MKKIIYLIFIFLLSFTLISCKDEEDNVDEKMENILNIYAINDFHGAVFESGDEIGISKIGNFLISEKEKLPNNTVIISAGDMFQGTALSSLTRGKVVVDLMNKIGFDAMVIGNHEFDWGVSEIIRYVDNNEENGEVNFPLLAANIYHKPTEKFVDWAKPYTVIKRGKFKIGILGIIGEELTSSILGSISKDYVFTNELAAIKQYVPILRKEEGVDIVIVATHSNTSNINYEIKNLVGDEYVDVVLNGHTHQYYAYEEEREGYPPLVVIQSGNNGKFVGHIALELDLENKKVIGASAGFVSKSKLNSSNKELDDIIANYQEYIDIENEVLGQAGTYINHTIGVRFAANTIGKFLDADVGVINEGGIRKVGFPISDGVDVTYGSIFKIMPFENKVITLDLTGRQLMQLLGMSGDFRYSESVNKSSYTVKGEPINENKLYKVAVIDYVYYRSENFFKYGSNITFHDVLFRDLLVEEVKASVEEYGRWYIK